MNTNNKLSTGKHATDSPRILTNLVLTTGNNNAMDAPLRQCI